MRRDERGAVAVLTAFVLVIMMGVAAIVVDIGMQRVARRDMQALADVVALDLARDLDGRTVSQLQAVVNADAAASVARNGSSLGEGAPALAVQLGAVSSTGAFQALTSGVPSAVRVQAATKVAFAFASFTGDSEGSVSRAAVSTASSNACFRLGSFAAALRTGDSALAGVFESMLGSTNALGINLKSVGYTGLLDSNIGLSALAAQLGVGSPQALVQQGNVSVKQVLSAGAQVLTANGQTSAGAVLGQIAAKVSSTVVANLGNVLSIGDGQGAGASINALDLVGGTGLAAALAASVSDHNNFLHTGVAWSAPHASNGDIDLALIEAPRQACGTPGSASASTGQLQLTASIGFNLPNKVAGLSVGSLADASSTQTSINVDAELGGAQGTLTGMSCSSALTETRVRVSTRLTKLAVSMPFQMNGSLSTTGIVPSSLLPAGLKNLVGVSVQLNLVLNSASMLQTAANAGTQDTLYDVPPHNYKDPQPSPGSSSAYVALVPPTVTVDLSASKATLVTPLGNSTLDVSKLDLSSIVSAATASVIGTSLTTVVGNLNQAVTPVAQLLGIRFAGADVFGVPTPTCGVPRLTG